MRAFVEFWAPLAPDRPHHPPCCGFLHSHYFYFVALCLSPARTYCDAHISLPAPRFPRFLCFYLLFLLYLFWLVMPPRSRSPVDPTVPRFHDPTQFHDSAQRYMAYVRQQQDFYPFLTVKETLLIDAGLRLGRLGWRWRCGSDITMCYKTPSIFRSIMCAYIRKNCCFFAFACPAP